MPSKPRRSAAALEAPSALPPQDFAWLPYAAAKPWDKNPRKNAKAVDPVARSIARFGFVRPITVWTSRARMVAGHTALKAFEAILLRGYRGADGGAVPANPGFVARGAPGPGMIPVRFHEFLDETEADAYAIADNKLGEIADWDEPMLAGLLAAQREQDLLLPVIAGFSPQEIAKLLQAHGQGGNTKDDDQSPEPSKELLAKWGVELGQIWEIPSLTMPGRCHRIMCGDSENQDQVRQLLAGMQLLQLVTDLPYGVEYDPLWRERSGLGEMKLTGVVLNDNKADWRRTWEIWDAPVAYVWHASLQASVVEASLRVHGYELRADIIWRKHQAQIGRGHYHWQHEKLFYMVKKGSRSGWCGDRTQSTIWDIDNLNHSAEGDDQKTGHGTQKPKECMARPMRNHNKIGAPVGDPFLGSGTSIIAAEREQRVLFGMELGPAFFAAILERCDRLKLPPRRAT